MRKPPRGGSRGQKERSNRQGRSDHPIATGSRAAVISLLPARRPFNEGRATVIGPVLAEPDTYDVRFPGSRRMYQRLIFPEFQVDPEGSHRRLLAAWKAAVAPEIRELFDFPEEPKRTPRRRLRKAKSRSVRKVSKREEKK